MKKKELEDERLKIQALLESDIPAEDWIKFLYPGKKVCSSVDESHPPNFATQVRYGAACSACECCYTCQMMVDDIGKGGVVDPPTMQEYDEYLNHEPIQDTEDKEPIALLPFTVVETEDGRKAVKLGGFISKFLYFCSFKWLKIRFNEKEKGEE